MKEATEDHSPKTIDPRIVDLLSQASDRTRLAEPTKTMLWSVDRVKQLRTKIDKLSEELSKMTEEYDMLVKESIPVAMLQMGVVKDHKGSVTLSSGEMLFLRPDVFVHVNADDRNRLHKWLRKKGHEQMVVEYVFPNSLKAHIKSILDEKRESTIPDFVKIHKFTRAILKSAPARRKG